jgi:hypothetical protein
MGGPQRPHNFAIGAKLCATNAKQIPHAAPLFLVLLSQQTGRRFGMTWWRADRLAVRLAARPIQDEPATESSIEPAKKQKQILRFARHGGQAQDDNAQSNLAKQSFGRAHCHFATLSSMSKPKSNGMCATVACISHLARTLVREREAQRLASSSSRPIRNAPKK